MSSVDRIVCVSESIYHLKKLFLHNYSHNLITFVQY